MFLLAYFFYIDGVDTIITMAAAYGRDLGLSEGTVKVHVSAILRALNVHTRAQAIAELARRGVAFDSFARRTH